jgi:NAD dependent epimerase/dehydratase family
MTFDLAGKRIWVAGHEGMVGAALVRRLRSESCTLLLGSGRAVLDLRRQTAVEDWMSVHRPQIVIIAAACVGGLLAHSSFPVCGRQQFLPAATRDLLTFNIMDTHSQISRSSCTRMLQ